MKLTKDRKTILLVVQLAAVCLFLGRAGQHLIWDAPYRSLLWDQSLMEPLIEGFTSMSWSEYSTNLDLDDQITAFIRGLGVYYLICALATIGLKKFPGIAQALLIIGVVNLFILALLYTKVKFYSPAQFFEYTVQWSTPLFLILLYRESFSLSTLTSLMKIAIALTFSAHGLYALNVFPRPVEFTEMTMSITGLGEAQALWFLRTAGILDLLLSVLIFTRKRWVVPALVYAACWGLATAVARIWANVYWDFLVEGLWQWAPETIMRIPHALIPLAAVLLVTAHRADTGTVAYSPPSAA